MSNIIETLVAARKAKGLSQKRLGALLNLPQSHISKIETGVINPHLSTLIEIARIIELEIRLVPKALLSIVDGLLTDKDISQEKSWTTDEKGNENDSNS